MTLDYTESIVRLHDEVMDGIELRQIRGRLRLTQAELAERLGVAPNTIARWERDELGIREPVVRLIRLVAQMSRSSRRQRRGGR